MNDITITYADREPMTLAELRANYDLHKPTFFQFVDLDYEKRCVFGRGQKADDYYVISGPEAGLVGKIEYCRKENVIPCTETGEPIEAGGEWQPLSEFNEGDLVEIEAKGYWRITTKDKGAMAGDWIRGQNPTVIKGCAYETNLPDTVLARRVSLEIKVTVK